MTNLYNTTLFIIKGSEVTIKVFLVVITLSIPLAMLLSLIKVSKSKVGRTVVSIYTWIFRGTPLLIQLFFIYFGVPYLGFRISRFNAAIITFTLNYAAYLTENFRGAIQSIDKGQYEASKALGMNNYHAMTRIIIPQAIRRAIPATCNEAISLVKDTAIVALIGMEEIIRAAKEIMTRDFTLLPFLIGGIVYLIIGAVIIFTFKRIEVRYSYYE